MMRCFFVDDEPNAVKLLQQLVKNLHSDLELVGEAHSVNDAYKKLLELKPDLVFLDIKIGEETGFDLLDKFKEIPFQVIFTTAYNQFALRAFDYNAVHYLLKPIDEEHVEKALLKLKQTSSQQQERNLKDMLTLLKQQQLTKVAIPSLESTEIILLEDLEYFEGDGSYTKVYLTNETHFTSSKSLAHFEKLLPSNRFARIHKRYLINADCIKSIDKGRSPIVSMNSGSLVPVSATYKDDLQRLLETKIKF